MVLKDVLPLCIQMRGDLCKSLRVCFVKSFQFRQGTSTQYQRLFNACHLMLYYLSISINHLRIVRLQYFPHKHIANLKRDLRSSPDLNSLAFKTCQSWLCFMTYASQFDFCTEHKSYTRGLAGLWNTSSSWRLLLHNIIKEEAIFQNSTFLRTLTFPCRCICASPENFTNLFENTNCFFSLLN